MKQHDVRSSTLVTSIAGGLALLLLTTASDAQAGRAGSSTTIFGRTEAQACYMQTKLDKRGPGGANRIRGASDIAAAFGSSWILEKRAAGSMVLTQTKNRHIQEPKPMRVTFISAESGGFRIVGSQA